jgi:hypothetical protein
MRLSLFAFVIERFVSGVTGLFESGYEGFQNPS